MPSLTASQIRSHLRTAPEAVAQPRSKSAKAQAAWNAAVYVAQIEDDRLNEVMTGRTYLEATQSVLKEYGGLWFNDETYVVVRKDS